MDNESMSVAPSEDNGLQNLMDESTPSEQTDTSASDATSEPTAIADEKPTEPELYELPDGRKVDAETLSKEWKENFYPEYTRKSQELANHKSNINNSNNTDSTWKSDEWAPSSYSELIEVAKQEMYRDLEQREAERIQQEQEITEAVTQQLNQVKKLDPSVNENALFLHATKYGFKDLTVAHQNMKDMAEMAKRVQQTTASNIAKRNDPVSVSPGAIGIAPDPSTFETARDYLKSLKT